MNENLLNTVTEVTEQHEKRIAQQEQTLDKLKSQLEELSDFKTVLTRFNGQVDTLRSVSDQWPKLAKEVVLLKERLSQTMDALSRPIEQKHHHYVSKIAWIAAGLFLVLSLTVCGWYMTHQRLQEFISNDTKYRYLKIQNDKELRQLVRRVDDQVQANPYFMRDSVLKVEEDNQRRLELLEEALNKEAEAKALRRRATK
ncbi:MAG TPA: hypothetical protein VM802_30435 [Chitinophaga sp.]|uniref:hypothetical protein n=1 Tax=Chitinophaga sp. TaxID=1869181 RepID=UPI002C32DA71|nr:hypothetical protein [Chitinophaga sp.]HVI49224.1 hypothetical protein [Chitinophaga sp.]